MIVAAPWRQAAELVLGGAITAAALADVFVTLLIPGPVGGRVRVVLAVRDLSLPLWKRAARRRPGRDLRPSNVFASATLALTFAAWLGMLLLGFGLLMHAVGDSFTPAVSSLGDALWVAGSSLLTLGVSEYDAHGPARWLVLASALSGFSALTASVTFMLQIQSGLHGREPAVLALVGLAGSPPSGLRVLEAFDELDGRDGLGAFFLQWRDWAAATLHTHLSYPVLNYYRSIDAEGDWLAALEAVLDAATLVMVADGDPARGPATLMHRTGSRMAGQLRALFGVAAADLAPDDDDLAGAVRNLAGLGYAVPDEAAAARRLASLRSDYRGAIEALAGHLGGNRAALAPR